jgi:hypothetical protein
MERKLELSPRFVEYLLRLPESGMGYQTVKVTLKSGKVIHGQKVLNSTILLQNDKELYSEQDISKIEIEKH